MRLATAFEVVLGLADLYTKEHWDDELLKKQRDAIADVEEFVRTYDFDDAPDTDD